MSGLKSRRKGSNFEREVVDRFTEQGLEAKRVPLSGAMSGYPGDVVVEGWLLECKRRAAGFKTLYAYLDKVNAAVVRDDHCPPLVIMPLSKFALLLKAVKESGIG